MYCNRVILKNSGSWHETYSMRSLHEVYDTQRTPISEFWLLAEEDGGERQCFMSESSLQVSIYFVYTKKQGRIILEDESVNFNRGLLYWEEGERTGNFLCFSKGDTDYDIIKVEAYGKKVRKLIHHAIKLFSPVLVGSTLENYATQALILKGDDADESIESETEA